MSILPLTTRASKQTYLAEVDGGKIVPFQFSLHELEMAEGGTYFDIVQTGNFYTDLAWISGRPTKFDFQFFIDRTQESFTPSTYNQDPFQDIKKLNSGLSKLNQLDALAMVQGVLRGNTSSGYQSDLQRGYSGQGNTVAPSNYVATPQFTQSAFDDNLGVYKDLEDILYFVRPKGMNLSRANVTSAGSVTINDFDAGRFVPPPKVRFFHGNVFREGYITEVKYKLTVMNKILVPQRLDANVTFACTKWGYLSDIVPTIMPQQGNLGQPIDGITKSTNTFV